MERKPGAEGASTSRPRARRQGALASTLPPRYRRQAWLAVTALLAFMALYAVLAGWFLRTAWRLSFGGSGEAGGRVLGFGVALCAAFLAIFMIKGVFFIRRGKPEGLTELRPADQPRLFKFLHKLADQAGAPRPYKVYVSARVNAAVFYDLSLLNLLLPSRKNLEIGLGLVNAVTLSELRAVLAHEFGHFAQRSMAVGRWVYIAHQITAQLVARRDKLDGFLNGLSRSDFRIAWIGWSLQTIVWAIRSLIDIAFRGVLAMQRALSREMELQADLVAVSLTGSDALIHALSKTNAADDSFDRALNFAQGEKARGAPPRDFFAVQQRLMARMAAILDDPLYGRVPMLPLADAPAHRLFKPELTQPPRMWLSHPLNHEREANAKKTYVPAPLDDRAAWVLFDEVQPLRERVTALLLQTGDAQPAAAEETLRRLDERFDRASLDRRYHGLYLGRSIARTSDAVDELYGKGAGTTADLSRLYPKSLADSVEQLRQLDRELAQLNALEAGVVEVAGGAIRYRGRDVPRRELPVLIERVKAERDEVRETLDAHERLCRRTHLAAARAADAAAAASSGMVSAAPAGSVTHESALRGLLAAIHYAEHGEAVARDLQAALWTTYRMLTAGGKITQAKLQPLYADCNRLHEALKRIHAQRAHVTLAPGLLARLGAASWAEAFGEFDLPTATTQNLQQWLGVIDTWVDKTANGCSSLRSAALDELLLAERALSKHVRRGDPLAPAPAACLVPAGYARLLRSQEQARKVKLTAWQRFLRASGYGPAALRVLVAGGIVGAVLAVGAGIGHADVVVYDALARPLHVRFGKQAVDVNPGAPVTLQVDPEETVAVETTTVDGQLVERFEAKVGGAFGTQVYNIAGASPLVILTATYGPATPRAPEFLGAPRWKDISVDNLFEDPPHTVQTKHGEGAIRRALRGFAGETPERMLTLLRDDPAQLTRVALAHARWDGGKASDLERWLSAAGMNDATRTVVAARLREQPDDVPLLRMEQALAGPGAPHDAVCARDQARAQQRPDDADRTYIALRCDPEGAARDAAFVDGHRRWPASPWFAYAAAWIDAGNARWQDAVTEFEQAGRANPMLGTESTLMVARILRLTGAPAGDLAALARRSDRLATLLALENPGAVADKDDGSIKRAYLALAQGDLRGMPDAADGAQAVDVDRWVRLAAASDGAPAGLVRRALALPMNDAIDGDTFWTAAGLAIREHQDLAPFEQRVVDDARAMPVAQAQEERRAWDVVRRASQPGAPALRDADLGGFDPEQRGHVYAALAVALGARAPDAWRDAASRLLFASERPYFSARGTASANAGKGADDNANNDANNHRGNRT